MALPTGVAPAPTPARAALHGPLNVLVVLVEFPGAPWTAAPRRLADLFFSVGVIPTGSVNEYYTDISGATVSISGTVVGPFKLPHALSSYANNNSGLGTVGPNARNMALDALNACRHTVNFAPYDNDADGFVDAFVVVHAGPGAEVTGSRQDIWSHKWTLPSVQSANGVQVYGYLTIPDDAKLGVCAHELGHLLFGWPDLYDTTGASSGLGDFCLMAGGAWGGGGDTPTHASAWCKLQQNWIAATHQTVAGAARLDDVKSTRTALRLWTGGAVGFEYFLLENRQLSGFDQSLPAGDLLLYHVDDSQPGNTNRNHYKVGLVQADGRRDLENAANRGDAGDPYPGSTGNTTFDGKSSPNSNDYAGAATGVSVRNIAVAGGVVSFDASV